MKSFPLIRLHWTNEHIMAALFVVLLLYMTPDWMARPAELTGFIPVLLLALAIDATANFIRCKRPFCSVSAAVTACVLQLLAPGIPLWGRLIGISAALLLGKHIWGGTGKNPLNPALTGLLLLGFSFRLEPAFTEPSLLYLPAVLLSLPFILFRPFAGIGLISGMAFVMLYGGGNNLWTVAVICIFFGCLIVTDPVTVTHKAVPGLIGGFAAGFIPLLLNGSTNYQVIGILAFNLISYLSDMKIENPKKKTSWNLFKIKSPVPQTGIGSEPLDLTGGREGELIKHDIPEAGEILRRIEEHGVFGMGGAGFPTAVKIRTVMKSDTSEKYLIVNGIECDPGLIHDKWLLKNRLNEINKGIEALCSCIGFNRAYLAVKDTSGISLKSGAELVRVPDMYPAGAERILVEKVLGISLSEGVVPAREGILIVNVQTVLSVYDAVIKDIDADTRYITASDLKNNKSRVVRVRLGDRIYEVLEKIYPGSNLVFAGGGVMQSHMADDGDLIDRSTNYIVSANMPKYKESPQCSHCGLCRTSCPVGLDAGMIAEMVDTGRISDTAALMPDRCLNCGSCSYVCLAGKNLSARVSEAKKYIAIGKIRPMAEKIITDYTK